MLTSLSLKNFKSWREIPEMRLAPITGLYGTHSSGKTSFLQLLLMLKQTAESEEKLAPAQAALYFRDVHEGESRLTSLDLDLFGNITNWPPGFFGDGFAELAQISQAIVRRKRSDAAA